MGWDLCCHFYNWFVIFLALLDTFYVDPKGIDIWWYEGLLLVLCMVAGVIIFGGAVAALRHQWEQRMLAIEKCDCNSKHSNRVFDEVALREQTDPSEFLLSSSIIRHVYRPDIEEIFETLSDRWVPVDVGVLVCGPRPLQSSVAQRNQISQLKEGTHQSNLPLQ